MDTVSSFDILKMAYDRLEQVSDTLAIAYDDEAKSSYIIDSNGNTLLALSGKKLDVAVYGKFMVIKEASSNFTFYVSSADNRVFKKLVFNSWWGNKVEATLLSSNYILLSLGNSAFIVDNLLNTVGKIDNIRRIYKNADSQTTKSYSYCTYSALGYKELLIKIDGDKQEIKYFDKISLTNRLSNLNTSVTIPSIDALAVRYTGGEISSCESKFKDFLKDFKYKIRYNNLMIGGEYDALIEVDVPDAYTLSNYVVCCNHRAAWSDKVNKGILNLTTGVEVIPVEFSKIEAFGKDMFICYREKNNAAYLYKIDNKQERNVPVLDSTDTGMMLHKTLPILIYIKNKKYMIYDFFGETYQFEDIAKHFPVEYCVDNRSILRINVTKNDYLPVYKYVDTQLTPIENIKSPMFRELLATSQWVRL